MKKKIALLLAVLLLACVLPLNTGAAGAEAPAVLRTTHVPLDAVQTQVLEKLEEALLARQETVDVREYHITLTPMMDVLNELNWNPELFFYDYASVSWDYSTEEVSTVELYYKENYGAAQQAAYEAAVQKALQALLPDMSDLQKALVLHDWLALRIVYDYDNYKADTVPEDSYNAYGALVNGTAVCEGYARAYQVLLGRCGVDAVMVSSLGMNHGWNLVKLGGSWYHVDVTWDDPTPDTLGKANHSYFLLSDAAIRSRDSGSGDRHYGWDGSITCSDTTFDGEAFWTAANQPLIFSDASTVWFMRSRGEGTDQVLALTSRDWASGKETEACSSRDYWPVWGENAYWIGAYSSVCSWGGWLFYNDSLHIYAYAPNDGTFLTAMTYTGGDGYIYGLAAAEDGLRYLVGKSPNEERTVHSFVPDVPELTPEPIPEPTPEPSPEPPPAPAPSIDNPFTDVSSSDYYYDAVLWAYENSVTKGTSDTAFSPAATCTRGQVVTFLYRAAGEPEPASLDNPFGDVKETDYFYKAVLWAVEQGITNGTGVDEATGKQLFSPSQTCSYAHILTFLYRAVTGNLTSVGAWYDDAFHWARDNGLLDGTLVGRDQGRVNADCPRCDVVTYLWRNAS